MELRLFRVIERALGVTDFAPAGAQRFFEIDRRLARLEAGISAGAAAADRPEFKSEEKAAPVRAGDKKSYGGVIALVLLMIAAIVLVAQFVAGLLGAAVLTGLFTVPFGAFVIVFPAAYAYFSAWNSLPGLVSILRTPKGKLSLLVGWVIGVALFLPSAYFVSRLGVLAFGHFIGIDVGAAVTVNIWGPLNTLLNGALAGHLNASLGILPALVTAVPGVAGLFLQRRVEVTLDQRQIDEAVARRLATA